MNTPTNELETSLLKQLLAEDEEDQKQIRFHEKRRKEREPLLRVLKGKLGVSTTDSENGYGNKAGMVRRAIKAIAGPRFTLKDVTDEIKRGSPDADISDSRVKSVLWGLQDRKELIKQVRPGNNMGQVAEYEKLPDPVSSSQVVSVSAKLPNTVEAMRRAFGAADNTAMLTVAALEDFVRAKNRRMNEVAAHFRVDASFVSKVMERSRVYEATRGWLKYRQ